MFYMTDRDREKRFRCEIRDGVYSEVDITDGENGEESETPTIINFVKVS
jgi:hypothetical protein